MAIEEGEERRRGDNNIVIHNTVYFIRNITFISITHIIFDRIFILFCYLFDINRFVILFYCCFVLEYHALISLSNSILSFKLHDESTLI